MKVLEDILGSENITALKKKGTEVLEAADAVVTEQYATAKPHIDHFVDNTVYPTYDRGMMYFHRAQDKVGAFLVKYL